MGFSRLGFEFRLDYYAIPIVSLRRITGITWLGFSNKQALTL
jgi:hypothetical protein